MTFANIGRLGVRPYARDELVRILTRPNTEMRESGCLSYDVGVNDESPGFVFVSELWRSADDHAASLQLESVRAAIAEARPLLTGEMHGYQFDVLGSPLRD